MPSNLDFLNTRKVLAAFAEALRFWSVHLTAKDGDIQKAVPPANTGDPLAELEKTSKLIKAHTTKVGIVFEPSQIVVSGSSTYSTVSDLSKSFILFMSAFSLVSPAEVSVIFYEEIRSVCTTLVNTAVNFTDELNDLLETCGESELSKGTSGAEPKISGEGPGRKQKATKAVEAPANHSEKEGDARLVSVGKIWNICDDLVKLIGEGKLKFLEKKTKMHLSLIEDGLDEFAQWAEDPDDFDDEDPFGLDEFSDEEGPSEPANSSDDEGVQENVISFSKSWLQKFKLVKLLFLSINKSLSSLVSGEKVDELFGMEAAICRQVDSLIVELMVNKALDEGVTRISKSIDDSCFSIIKLLRDVNNASENKVKWCHSWETKYSELLTEMYRH